MTRWISQRPTRRLDFPQMTYRIASIAHFARVLASILISICRTLLSNLVDYLTVVHWSGSSSRPNKSRARTWPTQRLSSSWPRNGLWIGWQEEGIEITGRQKQRIEENKRKLDFIVASVRTSLLIVRMHCVNSRNYSYFASFQDAIYIVDSGKVGPPEEVSSHIAFDVICSLVLLQECLPASWHISMHALFCSFGCVCKHA